MAFVEIPEVGRAREGMEGDGRHSLIQTGMTVVTGDFQPRAQGAQVPGLAGQTHELGELSWVDFG